MLGDILKQFGRFVKVTKNGNKIYEYQGYYWCVFPRQGYSPSYGYAWGSSSYFTDATI